jgi:purine-binding chemotaxis protein CheW
MSQLQQYVTLGVEAETFAIPVENVQEILDWAPVARLPQAPACVLGIIDVRGRAYPVVDLRTKLGMPRIEPTPATRIVVLRASGAVQVPALGLVADRVFEVTALDKAAEPPPDTGLRWKAEAIAGIGRRNDRFVVVLDLVALLADEAPLLASAELAA